MTIPTLTAEDLMRDYCRVCAAIRVLVWQTMGRNLTPDEQARAQDLLAERARLARLLWPSAKA